MPGLILEDVAFDVPAGPVGDVTRVVSEHLQALEHVSVRDAESAIGEHGVEAGGFLHARSHGIPFAPVRLVADHADRRVGRDLGSLGGALGAVAAAVIDDEDLACQTVGPEKLGGGLHVAPDFLALLKSRYNDGQIHAPFLNEKAAEAALWSLAKLRAGADDKRTIARPQNLIRDFPPL